jgi:hypothetical protein
MLEFLKTRISGAKLWCNDPVFGLLSTERIKGRGRPIGDPPLFEWFGPPINEPRLRFSKVEEVVIHAGHNGPSDAHRQGWLKLLTDSATFERVLKRELFDNYLWHKQALLKDCRERYGDEDLSRYESWPIYANADEAFASNCFDVCFLHVHEDHLEFYIFNDWDEEHNLRIWVRDGRFVELAQA